MVFVLVECLLVMRMMLVAVGLYLLLDTLLSLPFVVTERERGKKRAE